jgi:ectoine hydroxylase-related dioxygenase (phytanoyl-CoA dioxygenase family)
MQKEEFIEKFNTDGFVVVSDVFDQTLINKLKQAILSSLELQQKIVPENTNRYYGKLICAPVFGNSFPVFFELLEQKKWLQPVEWILDELFITYLYASSCIPPDNDKNSQYIHVDLPRLIEGYHTGMGVLINTDDFTELNGATLILKGSQHQTEQPTEEYFRQHASIFTGKAGSVLYFNPSIWHATGYNSTDEWRTSAVFGFSKPWMKQWVDIPRLMQKFNVDTATLSEHTKQLLGFYCQPPDNLEEFSKPKEERMFRQKTI